MGVAVAGVAWPLAAQVVAYEGGLSMATGNYIFTERTTSWSIFNGLAATWGNLTIRGTLPVWGQNTTLINLSGTGTIPTGGDYRGAVMDSADARKGRMMGGGGSGTGRVSSSVASMARGSGGDPVEVPATVVEDFRFVLGDPTIGARLGIPATSQLSLNAAFGVKIPVTDTSGFGTGQVDFGGSLGLTYAPGFTTLLGIDVAYWYLGDMPDMEFQDPLMGTASLAYLSPSGWGGSAWVSSATSPIAEYAAGTLVGVTLSRVTPATILSLNGSVGLTETAPDFTVGLSWRLQLFRGGA
jgi:hypothetical protein